MKDPKYIAVSGAAMSEPTTSDIVTPHPRIDKPTRKIQKPLDSQSTKLDSIIE